MSDKNNNQLNDSNNAAPPVDRADEEKAIVAGTADCDDEDDECGMFVVDDDGVPIDPAAEGSFMMAEGLSLLLMAQQGEAEDSQGGLVLEPYVPDFDVDEARAKSKAFFSRHNSAAMDVHPPSAPPAGGDAAIAGPRPAVETEENSDEDYAEEDQYDDEEEEEEDDFPAMGSRDMTDPDDWVLEAILKRRMNKEAPAGGPWVYWCKWKGHEEPTWETREVMEEAGWIPQLDAYDARGVHTKTNIRRIRITARRGKVDPIAQRLESYFGEDDLAVAKAIKAKGVSRLYHYTRVNESLAKAFYTRWESKKETHVPTLVFHGTRAANLLPISRVGLVVGGTRGVAVSNGSVFGSGVYTATSPSTPYSYAECSNSLIVCIGLVPIKIKKNDQDCEVYSCSSDYLIFRSAADVYPMWLIQTGGAPHDSLPTEPTQMSLARFLDHAYDGFGEYPRPRCSPNPNAVRGKKNFLGRNYDEENSTLTSAEERDVSRVIKQHLTTGNKKGFSKAALKAQPRRIKDLLARMNATK